MYHDIVDLFCFNDNDWEYTFLRNVFVQTFFILFLSRNSYSNICTYFTIEDILFYVYQFSITIHRLVKLDATDNIHQRISVFRLNSMKFLWKITQILYYCYERKSIYGPPVTHCTSDECRNHRI